MGWPKYSEDNIKRSGKRLRVDEYLSHPFAKSGPQLAAADRRLRCGVCGAEFIFTAEEQGRFETEKPALPQSCPACRENNSENTKKESR